MNKSEDSEFKGVKPSRVKSMNGRSELQRLPQLTVPPEVADSAITQKENVIAHYVNQINKNKTMFSQKVISKLL